MNEETIDSEELEQAAARSRSQAATVDATTVLVRLPGGLGVKRCGPYRAGVVYTVSADEGRRLIEAKRFEPVDGEDETTHEV